MVTTATQLNASFPRGERAKHNFLRFGSAPLATVVRTGRHVIPSRLKDASIRGIHLAEAMQGFLSNGLLKGDVRRGGLSLEDVAGRLQTLIGVYLLQGYFSIKDDKHPWETNGRNAVVWGMTVLLTWLTKSDKFGVNVLLFNPLMKEKGHESFRLKPLQQLIDRFRLNVDYLKILQAAGIALRQDELDAAKAGKQALWASSWLDSNKVDEIKNLYTKLDGKLKSPSAQLTAEERKLLEAIPKFFQRINLFNLGSTALITLLTIYLIGGVAMDIVNKVIAPLDKDYEGKDNKYKKLSPHTSSAKGNSPPPGSGTTQAPYFPPPVSPGTINPPINPYTTHPFRFNHPIQFLPGASSNPLRITNQPNFPSGGFQS